MTTRVKMPTHTVLYFITCPTLLLALFLAVQDTGQRINPAMKREYFMNAELRVIKDQYRTIIIIWKKVAVYHLIAVLKLKNKNNNNAKKMYSLEITGLLQARACRLQPTQPTG